MMDSRIVKTILLGMLLSAGSLCSGAAGMSPDPTGLWMAPAESGWGLSLAQQGDTVFATLFVYDDAHRPAWYVAPAVRDDGRQTLVAAEPVFAGTLYRTSGPVFSGAFDPHAVTSTPVGQVELQYAAGNGGKVVNVAYTIDGVHVTKTVQPQTWGESRSALIGSYVGARPLVTASPATCDPNNLGVQSQPNVPFGFTVKAGPAPEEIKVEWGVGVDVLCSLDGTYAQRGQLGTVTGAIGCFPFFFPAIRNTPAELTELAIGPHGFAGLATFHQGSCTYTTNFGGVRQP